MQIRNRTTIARYQLQKLNRFRHAPAKIKLYLYKALIRPLLEYPPTRLAKSCKTNLEKLQKIQNRALRFVYNVKWDDFTSNQQLHVRAKIPTMTERLNKLSEKADVTFKDNLLTEEKRLVTYKFSDYEIEQEPIFQQQNLIYKYYKKWEI